MHMFMQWATPVHIKKEHQQQNITHVHSNEFPDQMLSAMYSQMS